jgi:hypothetical protein
MKYAIFSSFDPKDRDKVVERGNMFNEERKKHPEKYPKFIFPSHNMAGGAGGLAIVEATTEQMMAFRYIWMPYMTIEAIPLFEQGSKIAEKYPKLMK